MRLGGRTTKQLILDRVLLEAARLLRFSDLSIKEIAARLGFPDQFAFSKAFKRQRGRGAARLPQPPLARLAPGRRGRERRGGREAGAAGKEPLHLLTSP